MDIHLADPAYRRRSSLALAAVLIVLITALWALHGWLGEVIRALPAMAPELRRAWFRGLFTALFAGIALPLALAARSFHQFARGVQAEGRLPPRAWRTWRDVRVLRGPCAQGWAMRAHRIATVVALASGVLGGCAIIAWVRFS